MKKILSIFITLSLILSSYGCSRNDTELGECVYKVNTETFERLRCLVPPKPGESNQALLIRYLDEQHIKTKNPPIIFLDEKNGTLKVMAIGADQDKIAFYLYPLIKKRDQNPNSE